MKIKQKQITEDAIGRCGVFCAGCPSYNVGTCHGCRSEIQKQKRTSKWKCQIRLCCLEKGNYSCGDCLELKTCKIRKNVVKTYMSKYNLDLILNAKEITDLGPTQWLSNQIEQYKCPLCKGVISPYNNKCFHC